MGWVGFGSGSTSKTGPNGKRPSRRGAMDGGWRVSGRMRKVVGDCLSPKAEKILSSHNIELMFKFFIASRKARI